MAVAQDTFTQYRGKAYEGQISTTEITEIMSRTVETAAIPFGRAVIAGTGARSCTQMAGASVAADVIGFTVRSMAVENNASDEAEYAVGDVASILRDGPMFAKCVDGASKGDTVHVVKNTAGGDALGELRGAADSTNTIELNQVKWVEDVAAGEIGEIRVDGILAT